MTTDLPAPKILKRKGKAKFRNVRVEYDGIKFDSKRECAHYQELKMLEAAGEISQLRVHPRDFTITINNSASAGTNLTLFFTMSFRDASESRTSKA